MKLANERREKPRINLKGAAFLFDSHGRQQVALRNLSAVGVLVEMPNAPTRGATVLLGICLDGKSWIELAGRVRRVVKKAATYECAVDLRPSACEARHAIETYVERVTAALSMAKQREVFARRMTGVEHAPPRLSRDELIRQALPTAVLPPGSEVTSPPQPVQQRPIAPAQPKPQAKPAERTDPRLASLYRAAVQDLDRKR
jgi:hypothetical protein